MLLSYLTQRQQIAECNGSQSNSLEIKTGIPEGCVLGPILFSVYINNLTMCTVFHMFFDRQRYCLIMVQICRKECIPLLLPLCTDMFNTIMYADDTTLFCDINNIPDVEHSMNAELI